MPEGDKMRGVKPGLKEWKVDQLSDELKALHYHLSDRFPDDYVMTDGKRKKDSKIGSINSKHKYGEAIDIRPNSKVYDYLMNTAEGIKWLDKSGVGVFDETDPKNMGKATGEHFHVGTDFHNITKERLKNLDLVELTPGGNKVWVPTTKADYYGRSKKSSEYNTEHNHEYKHDHGYYTESVIGGESDNISEIQEQNRLLKEQLDKINDVEEEKHRKLEEQSELRQLREKENEKLSFLESMIDRPAYVERDKPSTQQQSPGAYKPNPTPQQQMDLPNIWDFGQ